MSYYSPTLTRVMGALVAHADAAGDAQVSQAELARVTGLPPTVVAHAMAVLRAEGVVVSRVPTRREASAAARAGYGAPWVHRVYLYPEERRSRFAVVSEGAS